MNRINAWKKLFNPQKLTIFLFVLVIILEGCTVIITPTSAPPPRIVGFLLDNNPITEAAKLHVLCYKNNAPGQLTSGSYETINDPNRTVLPDDCYYLAASYELYKQPSWRNDPNQPAYWVYATSWDRHQSNPIPASGNINISSANKLTMFNLVVSLEWQPEQAPEQAYVTGLEEGLKSASGYLYGATDGQMAFGNVMIYSGGENWDNADLRILASNDRRPSAFVGGIVSNSLTYHTPSGKESKFSPGRILLGRYWNGNEASSGNWIDPKGYQTIIHEWAHYALFLYDEYLHVTTDPSLEYCTRNDLPLLTPSPSSNASSIMAYHYSASEFWHPNETPSPPELCTKSLQGYVYGLSDWETLAHWGAIQGLPFEPLSIPQLGTSAPQLGVVSDFFRIVDSTAPAENSTYLFSENFKVPLQNNWNLPVSQAYVVQPDGGILHQGGVQRTGSSSGTIQLIGIPSANKIWISSDLYNVNNLKDTAARYVAEGNPSEQTLSEHIDNWNADIDLIYTVDNSSNFTSLKVRVSDNLDNPRTPIAELCTPSITNIGFSRKCTLTLDPNNNLPINMVQVGKNIWEFTFTTEAPLGPHTAPQSQYYGYYGVEELPLYGLVRVHGGSSGEDELIRWYEDDRGLGPAHMGGDAPGVDGAVMVNTLNKLPIASCSRVFAMPAADFDAVSTLINDPNNTTSEQIQGIIGIPLDVDILMPQNCPTSGSSPSLEFGDHSLPVPVTLTMFYPKPRLTLVEYVSTFPFVSTASLQPVLFQSGNQTIDPKNLRLLHFDRSNNKWIVYPHLSDADENLGWIAQEINVDGIYAIGWIK